MGKGKVQKQAQAAGNDESITENASLDQLFSMLAKETASSQTTELDEFAQIQAGLDKLPKIESAMEFAAPPPPPTQIVKINDPLTHIEKNVDKDADSGSRWFNMKKRELTPELKRDLMVIRNRSILDRKRHYKKEKWVIPKYFHTGTIVEGNTEFYSARMSKKSRGKSLAHEILQDMDSSQYFKRKYLEIQKERKSGGKTHYKKVKDKRRA